MSCINQQKILVVDDDELTRALVAAMGQRINYEVEQACNGIEALNKSLSDIRVALIDLEMPEMGGMHLIRVLREQHPEIKIIVISGVGQLSDAVAAMKLGVNDYLQKPLEFSVVAAALRRCISNEDIGRDSHVALGTRESIQDSELAPKDSWKSALLQVATLDGTVLLTGETGVGKSVAARFVHEHSRRASSPFVTVNCASLPRDLIEGELFGHKKGAFTGAIEDRVGRTEMAAGGTLFLDEIGDLPLELQPKLLTFLQERTAYRIGSNVAYKVDCRVIAATHHDLLSLCRKRQFRADLYFRLDVLRVALPPLRERTDEIRTIVVDHLKRLAERDGKRPPTVTKDFMRRIMSHSWPGNIRELENVLERAVAFSEDGQLTSSDLRMSDFADCVEPMGDSSEADSSRFLTGMTLDEIEKLAIKQTLAHVGGNKARAARELGISEKSIYNKMRRLGMEY
jgi:DNA-binding NtrC family response regulator